MAQQHIERACADAAWTKDILRVDQGVESAGMLGPLDDCVSVVRAACTDAFVGEEGDAADMVIAATRAGDTNHSAVGIPVLSMPPDDVLCHRPAP